MTRLTIAFHSNQISLRGTEVALYDYAVGAEAVLGHRAVILHDATHPGNDGQAIAKFRARFEVAAYRDRGELDGLLQRHGAQLLYAIKSGKNDGLMSHTVPTMVHAVFPTHPRQMHGASYAFISEWLSRRCSAGRIPAVPHIVSLPAEDSDLRAELGIPTKAKVLGCHGGAHSFDVPAAIEAVKRVLATRDDTWFLFLNIEPFVDHPRARFLPGTSDLVFKTRFINSCDAMLHARLQGESFGLACGEFSVRNKPVLTYARSKHRHHLDVLGDAGWPYRDADDLVRRIESLDPAAVRAGSWDRYTPLYNPERVMGLFDQHLIQPALRNPSRERPQLHVPWVDTLAYWRLKLDMRLRRGARL
ncbi:MULTISPECIES: hypothetical protein [Hydrogenophaga]|uniref:hypothetical protein n=1 Tax=Hydrogenophaga TaxID=47420 RepID=UPI000878E4DE|nr:MULTISPECIES: hypothetical protein [unclassified Hydrogenophaga]MBN9370437.1 hypothetical protein [Hydrogenophaga sp.]OJV61624.1 MAG: hypothetical protein BGO22_00105 [Hydrogenophaga sp. 70-12]